MILSTIPIIINAEYIQLGLLREPVYYIHIEITNTILCTHWRNIPSVLGGLTKRVKRSLFISYRFSKEEWGLTVVPVRGVGKHPAECVEYHGISKQELFYCSGKTPVMAVERIEYCSGYIWSYLSPTKSNLWHNTPWHQGLCLCVVSEYSLEDVHRSPGL